MVENRQKVENPFELGARPDSRVKYQPDLQSRVAPRISFNAAPSEGTYIADALVKFAGVAGDAYVKKLNKDIEADKIEQTGLAMEGFKPSDDATVAGYRAHAALRMKNKAMEEEIYLNQLASEGVEGEEWKMAKRDSYKRIDDFMMKNYDLYEQDEELQKLSVLTMREMMPQITAKKLSADMEREIQQRINSGTDALIQASKRNLFKVTDPKDMKKVVDDLFGSLRLTASQKDKIWIEAVKSTEDITMINASKHWMGDHETSLYDRSGTIQAMESKLKDEELATNSVDLAVETKTLVDGYYTGEFTEEQFLDKVDKRNKELGGGFMSKAKIMHHLDQMNTIKSSKYKSNKISQDILNPDETNIKGKYEKKDVQRAYKTIIDSNTNKIIRQASRLPEEERAKYIEDNIVKSTRHVVDMSIKSGVLIDSVVADLNNLSKLNVDAQSETVKTDIGETMVLSPTANRAINLFDSMSDIAKDQYLKAIGEENGDVIRNYFHLTDMNMTGPQALKRAQISAKNPAPIDEDAVDKGVEKVVDKQDYFLWWGDFPKNQSSYMEEAIRKKVRIDPAPSSDRNIDLVSSWLKEGWTKAGSLRIEGSPEQIRAATDLEPGHFKQAFKALVYSQEETLVPKLEGYGYNLSMEDVFPATDPDTETVHLRTKFGPIPGTTRNLSELKRIALNYKNKLEKIKDEKEFWGHYRGKRAEEKFQRR